MDSEKILELEKEIEHLRELVNYDELTKALNRRGFNEEAGILFKAATLTRQNAERRRLSVHVPLSLILLDVDDFKKINDTYGHDIGDKVLRTMSDTLHSHLRGTDVMGRWGGEEFVILLFNVDKEDASLVAEKLRRAIEEIEIKISDEVIKVTGSFGIKILTDEKDLIELISGADKAMYQAKQQGKNQVVIM